MIKVFLADDHALVREGLKMILELTDDIRVVGEASDGRQAVAQVLETHPDVLLLDITMPGLNGIEAAVHIHKVAPEVKMAILSMHLTKEYVYRSFLAGATAYLLKDSAGVEVVDAVRAVMDGQRYLSAAIDPAILKDYDRRKKVKTPLESLSAREREVLQLTVEGKTAVEAARILSLSPKTVETYRSRLMTKLGVEDMPALVKFAIQHGMTSV
jgi:DNA-binding NarL/FixJ family response regulator